MKVVLDTNALQSCSLFPKGVPGRIVEAWTQARFDVTLSIEQLGEIARAFTYPTIRRRLRWDDQSIEQFLKQLYIRMEVVELSAVSVEAPRDAGDEPILATLIAAKADSLVTGDRDLLALRERYPIETSAEFVRRLWRRGVAGLMRVLLIAVRAGRG